MLHDVADLRRSAQLDDGAAAVSVQARAVGQLRGDGIRAADGVQELVAERRQPVDALGAIRDVLKLADRVVELDARVA